MMDPIFILLYVLGMMLTARFAVTTYEKVDDRTELSNKEVSQIMAKSVVWPVYFLFVVKRYSCPHKRKR